MNKNAELANVIENFIDKYWRYPSWVEWPECDFKIVEVCQVKIEKDSLTKVGNLWTFKGSGFIRVTDKSKVETNKEYTIIGNATIESHSNAINHEEQNPEVKHIVITKIK